MKKIEKTGYVILDTFGQPQGIDQEYGTPFVAKSPEEVYLFMFGEQANAWLNNAGYKEEPYNLSRAVKATITLEYD